MWSTGQPKPPKCLQPQTLGSPGALSPISIHQCQVLHARDCQWTLNKRWSLYMRQCVSKVTIREWSTMMWQTLSIALSLPISRYSSFHTYRAGRVVRLSWRSPLPGSASMTGAGWWCWISSTSHQIYQLEAKLQLWMRSSGTYMILQFLPYHVNMTSSFRGSECLDKLSFLQHIGHMKGKQPASKQGVYPCVDCSARWGKHQGNMKFKHESSQYKHYLLIRGLLKYKMMVFRL